MTTDTPASQASPVLVPGQRPTPAVPPEGRGRTEVTDRVAAKIARCAAGEVAGVREVIERGGGLRGTRPASATVRGDTVEIGLTVSVAYPMPLRVVAAAIRSHVASRIAALTGLEVSHVDITMAELTAPPAPTWGFSREAFSRESLPEAPRGSSREAFSRESLPEAPQETSWETSRQAPPKPPPRTPPEVSP
ncbi:Asp23/Gls24 family envelope stress response protein [Nonomuraea sp. CA-143628]|uniref:Asp23/Gls24 family envelope stress response protein n=1 Tax=Nonomuraea sp. CA-143628 TaxID=3239997 RepID=UPI003D945FBA